MRWPFPGPDGLKSLAEEGVNMLLTFPDIAWFGGIAIDAIQGAHGIKEQAKPFVPSTMK
jgi:hypothetical protein